MINLKVSPEEKGGGSPFLVTHSIKNRSSLVLYKVMIKKGLYTLKNEASKRENLNNESTMIEPAAELNFKNRKKGKNSVSV